jgi:hypothetical protein
LQELQPVQGSTPTYPTTAIPGTLPKPQAGQKVSKAHVMADDWRFCTGLPNTSRRHFLKLACGAGATGTLTSLCRGATPDKTHPWQVGAAVADITPPLNVGLLMSSGRELWEPFEGVRLPICVRTVVVERDGQRVAIVSLDLLGLAGGAVGGINCFKRQVVQAADSLVRASELILCCTHTHTSPESAALTDLYQTPAFQAWSKHLAQSIAATIRDATDAARPCRLTMGSHLTSGMTLNRRIQTTKGIRSVRHPIPPDEFIGPEGPTDDMVRVAAFVDGTDKPVAMLINFTAHPVIEMCIKQMSPDYPGEMCLQLEQRHPDAMPLFLQGACGNINPPNVGTGAEDSRQYGHQLADAVDEALKNSTLADGDELLLRWRSVALPLRSDEEQPEGKSLSTRIAAAKIGNAAMVFLPGEPFVEIALAIHKASPFPFTAVVGYSDDYIGYVPTDRAFDNGGYEVKPGRWSRLAPGSEAIVRDKSIQLLGALQQSLQSERSND